MDKAWERHIAQLEKHVKLLDDLAKDLNKLVDQMTTVERKIDARGLAGHYSNEANYYRTYLLKTKKSKEK